MGKLAPNITINLDRERKLSLTLNSMIAFKKKTGKDLTQIFTSSGAEFDLEQLRTVLFAGLIAEDSTLTEEQVGDMIHIGNLEEVTEAITELMTGSMPESKPAEESEAEGTEKPKN